MSAALDASDALAPVRPKELRPALTVEATRDFAAIEAEWRDMERDAPVSPYQRFDWMASFREGCPGEVGDSVALVGRDGAGRAAMILPLSIRRVAGVAVASGLGGRHANYHMPLRRSGSEHLVTDDAFRRLLIEGGRALGADVFSFVNVPSLWRGERNPLALDGRPNPSDSYRLTLGPDPDAVLAAALSKDARKKLRQKNKHLRSIGPVAHRIAATEDEARGFLDAFYAQKAARFAALGIPDAFAGEGVRRFLLTGALAGLASGQPAIALHALTVGDRIVAVFGAAVDASRCSGMVISFDGDPAIARCSPGDLLVTQVIRAQCLAGRETFDLGVGEARYKDAFCPEAEPLVQATLPVSSRGALYARSRAVAAAAKRAVKRNPRLFALASRLRASAVWLA